MKILLVSATSFEIAPYIQYLENNFEKKSFFEFTKDNLSIYILVTGVGALNTSFAIARIPNIKEFDLAINAGLGGAFNLSIPLGTVVEIFKDRFSDLGVEENDSQFTDVYELDLVNKNQFPFVNGQIVNQNKFNTSFPKYDAITVNTVHGTAESIDRIKAKYNPTIESMEGAGFFYACKILDLTCVQIRSISNHVIPRDKDKWKIQLAIDNLNKSLINYINFIEQTNF